MIAAVCGKGGVGKTAVTALLARALLENEASRPVLLIDADPVQGLTSAIGETAVRTLGDVRHEIIATLREGVDAKKYVADRLDYMVLEALAERDGYSLFAMGRKQEKGCFCPVNTLLRQAIDLISEPFAHVLVDAEAGLEQINRQVTRRTQRVLAVTDGSQRSRQTLELIAEMVPVPVGAVANRGMQTELPEGVDRLGEIPEDETLRRFDAEGRSLWELPDDNPALEAAREVARALGWTA